jgi:hypothetical protein
MDGGFCYLSRICLQLEVPTLPQAVLQNELVPESSGTTLSELQVAEMGQSSVAPVVSDANDADDGVLYLFFC